MESLQEIYQRILIIDWFSNCGKEMNDIGINYEPVKDWNRQLKSVRVPFGKMSRSKPEIF